MKTFTFFNNITIHKRREEERKGKKRNSILVFLSFVCHVPHSYTYSTECVYIWKERKVVIAQPLVFIVLFLLLYPMPSFFPSCLSLSLKLRDLFLYITIQISSHRQT